MGHRAEVDSVLKCRSAPRLKSTPPTSRPPTMRVFDRMPTARRRCCKSNVDPQRGKAWNIRRTVVASVGLTRRLRSPSGSWIAPPYSRATVAHQPDGPAAFVSAGARCRPSLDRRTLRPAGAKRIAAAQGVRTAARELLPSGDATVRAIRSDRAPPVRPARLRYQSRARPRSPPQRRQAYLVSEPEDSSLTYS